jgi:hypothetical protein
VLPLLIADSEQAASAEEQQAPRWLGVNMRLGGSSSRISGSYRAVRTLLGVGVLIDGGHGWRHFLPGKSKRGSADHVICPREKDGCGPHWVHGYEERNPPPCSRHGTEMRLCKGCRHSPP